MQTLERHRSSRGDDQRTCDVNWLSMREQMVQRRKGTGAEFAGTTSLSKLSAHHLNSAIGPNALIWMIVGLRAEFQYFGHTLAGRCIEFGFMKSIRPDWSSNYRYSIGNGRLMETSIPKVVRNLVSSRMNVLSQQRMLRRRKRAL